MAQIEQSDGGKKKKGAQKKMQIHVDFTPMVDMNMLLITFFMLCTTMIKSQTLLRPSNLKLSPSSSTPSMKATSPRLMRKQARPFITSTIMKVSPTLHSRRPNISCVSNLSATRITSPRASAKSSVRRTNR